MYKTLAKKKYSLLLNIKSVFYVYLYYKRLNIHAQTTLIPCVASLSVVHKQYEIRHGTVYMENVFI